jgi:hypothetical protein
MKAPMRLWRRFQIWRAKRMYERVARMELESRALFEKANDLMRRHAEDPQARLPLGDD